MAERKERADEKDIELVLRIGKDMFTKPQAERLFDMVNTARLQGARMLYEKIIEISTKNNIHRRDRHYFVLRQAFNELEETIRKWS